MVDDQSVVPQEPEAVEMPDTDDKLELEEEVAESTDLDGEDNDE